MGFPTLYQFFHHQVRHGFQARGISGAATIDYVSDLLTRFAQVRALYAIRDAENRPIERIVDLLVEWQEAEDRSSRSRMREHLIARHLGEYALFMSGLFRERVRKRGELEYYLAHGAGGFWRSADYEPNQASRQLYQRLYRDFRKISDALDHLRRVQFPMAEPEFRRSPDVFAAFWRV